MRPPQLRRPILDHVLRPLPAPPLRLTPAEVGDALRTAKRGAAPGLSGSTMDHYKVLLEDEDAFAHPKEVVNRFPPSCGTQTHGVRTDSLNQIINPMNKSVTLTRFSCSRPKATLFTWLILVTATQVLGPLSLHPMWFSGCSLLQVAWF